MFSSDAQTVLERPLMAWLSGPGFYLKSPLFIACEGYKLSAAWLVITQCVPVHEANSVELRPFDDTWEKTLSYIGDACRILNRPRPGWAPSLEEADTVLQQLGLPPLRCHAIYMIVVGPDTDQKCVYVGQTNAGTHRFQSGHSAISQLHHPKYEGIQKRIYFAGIEIEDDDDHTFPLEWIHPVEWRQEVLDSIEGRFIFDLQPELNSRGRKSFSPKIDLPIAVQNLTNRYLDAQNFGPSRESNAEDDT